MVVLQCACTHQIAIFPICSELSRVVSVFQSVKLLHSFNVLRRAKASLRRVLKVYGMHLLSSISFLASCKFTADCFVAATPPLSQYSCNIRYIHSYCCYLQVAVGSYPHHHGRSIIMVMLVMRNERYECSPKFKCLLISIFLNLNVCGSA
jgi:hypothetical protein